MTMECKGIDPLSHGMVNNQDICGECVQYINRMGEYSNVSPLFPHALNGVFTGVTTHFSVDHYNTRWWNPANEWVYVR